LAHHHQPRRERRRQSRPDLAEQHAGHLADERPDPYRGGRPPNPGANWHLVGSGDTNGDGRGDLIWQEAGGTLGVWLMNGTTPIAEAGIGNPGPTWKVVGAADFNSDGRDDILCRTPSAGT
jgi:hypothetical protein